MDVELNPAQRRVVDELLGAGQRDPHSPADLPVRLRDASTERPRAVASRLGRGELWVSKARLQRILACEQHDQSQNEAGFEWSPATARGTVVHRALELLINLPQDTPPLDAVDGAMRQLEREGRLADWLSDLDPADKASLRSGGHGEIVNAFGDAGRRCRTTGGRGPSSS